MWVERGAGGRGVSIAEADGMDEVGPPLVVKPERAAAPGAEVPLGRAAARARGARLAQLGVVDRDVLAAGHAQGLGVPAEVDGVAAPARSLAADGAVAALVRKRVRRAQPEPDRPAVAGAFELIAAAVLPPVRATAHAANRGPCSGETGITDRRDCAPGRCRQRRLRLDGGEPHRPRHRPHARTSTQTQRSVSRSVRVGFARHLHHAHDLLAGVGVVEEGAVAPAHPPEVLRAPWALRTPVQGSCPGGPGLPGNASGSLFTSQCAKTGTLLRNAIRLADCRAVERFNARRSHLNVGVWKR
jgi:hypothetical protein